MLARAPIRRKKAQYRFSPDFICSSIADIDFEYLKKIGITTCFIDLDGTVVSKGTYAVDPAVGKVLKKSDLKVHIATNRPRSRDLKNLKADLHADSVIHPRGISPKPSKQYYRYALRDLNLKPGEVVMIGDRYIQDIFGANRSGLYSLVVYKLGKSQGYWDRILSIIEKVVTEKFSTRYHKT